MKKQWTKNEDNNFKLCIQAIWEQEFYIKTKLNLCCKHCVSGGAFFPQILSNHYIRGNKFVIKNFEQ